MGRPPEQLQIGFTRLLVASAHPDCVPARRQGERLVGSHTDAGEEP